MSDNPARYIALVFAVDRMDDPGDDEEAYSIGDRLAADLETDEPVTLEAIGVEAVRGPYAQNWTLTT